MPCRRVLTRARQAPLPPSRQLAQPTARRRPRPRTRQSFPRRQRPRSGAVGHAGAPRPARQQSRCSSPRSRQRDWRPRLRSPSQGRGPRAPEVRSGSRPQGLPRAPAAPPEVRHPHRREVTGVTPPLAHGPREAAQPAGFPLPQFSAGTRHTGRHRAAPAGGPRPRRPLPLARSGRRAVWPRQQPVPTPCPGPAGLPGCRREGSRQSPHLQARGPCRQEARPPPGQPVR